MNHWMMAKEAEFVGDLQDAKSIYDTVLDLTGGAKDKDAAPTQMRAIVLCDTAELALRMHDYASSLKQLDELISYNPNLAEGSIGNSISLFRAAALIGLSRKTEADKVLTALLQHLDYGGISPWEGWPLGPQPVSPYNVARRVAAYYVSEHRYTDALALLKELEEKRQKTLAEAPARPEPGGYWAEHVKLEDFMDDEADVYIAQGKDSEAEKLLQDSLALRKNAPATQQERYVLEKLAALEQRMGKTAESASFSQRAAALVIKTDLAWTDPLDDILGLPNPTHLAD